MLSVLGRLSSRRHQLLHSSRVAGRQGKEAYDMGHTGKSLNDTEKGKLTRTLEESFSG